MIKISNKCINEMGQFLEMGQVVFLNKKTGKINQLADRNNPYYEEEFWEEDYKKIEENSDDYIRIDQMESHKSFQIMEDFVDTVVSEETRKRLTQALNGYKPFRNFKHQIDHSEERQNWFAFKINAYENFVRKHLSFHLKDSQLESEEE